MSMVTSVVFVCRDQKVAERFQEIYATTYTRYGLGQEIFPQDSHGKVSGTYVFHAGVNYADEELITALTREPWPPETMLWIEGENDTIPEIHVGTLFVRAAVKDWS